MLKSLSVAAILLAASLAHASNNGFDNQTYDIDSGNNLHFRSSFNQDKRQGLRKAPSTTTVAPTDVPSYLGKSDAEETDGERTDFMTTKSKSKSSSKTKGVTSFKSKHKKWLKETGKATPHLVTLKRQKPTHKDGKKLSKKEKKKAKKSKKAVVNNTLNVKTSNSPIKITVNTQAGLKKGVNVFDGEEKLFQTSKRNYAIVEGGKHSFSLESKHSRTANAHVTLEKIKTKKLSKKYFVVTTPVAFSDAHEVCEFFGGSLASISRKDIEKLQEKYNEKELAKKGIDRVWVDQVSWYDEERKETLSSFSSIPQVVSFRDGSLDVDPERIYNEAIAKHRDRVLELNSKKDDGMKKKKYKKALKKIQKKTRKEMDKVKITKTAMQTHVLCKF